MLFALAGFLSFAAGFAFDFSFFAAVLRAAGQNARRIPALKTERLVLRAPSMSDVSAMVALAGDRHVAENTARIPHPYTAADAEGLLASINQKGSEKVFAIELDGALIGMSGLDPRTDGAELGYWLGVPFWGCGYATEAVRAVIDYAFSELGHELLHSGARVSNPASRRVLEKCVGKDHVQTKSMIR